MGNPFRRSGGPFNGGLPSGVIGRSDPSSTVRRPTRRVVPAWPDPDFEDPVPGPSPSPRGSYTEKTYSAPGTILDQVIPMVYGEAKVPGYCAAWDNTAVHLVMAFIFCHGEQAALNSIEINGEAIAGLSWVDSYNVFLGDGTGTRPTYMSFVDATTWARMTDFCMVTVDILIRLANCPGSFQVTGIPTGRKFASFQSPYTSSNHTNLAEIAFDILTDDVWKGLASTVAGVEAGGTWEVFADHCDEVMGDTSERYSFNGVISERDPDKAIDLVLQAGFASKYFSPDGKIQIWSEAPPPAITGTWSATASATLTGSGGDAANEVEVDDIVYADTTPAIVTAVGGANSITIDRAVTISADLVRMTSGVYLKLADWVQTPEGREIETGSIPDEVRVRYTLSNYWGSMMYPEEPTQDKRVEITVEACNNASMARRISETKENLMSLQPFSYRAVADAHAAGLEPGDVFFIDDDVLEFEPMRVLPPVSQTKGGAVAIRFRSYAISAVSDSTQTDPTIPTQPDSYASGGTPHFGAINTITSSGTPYNFFAWVGGEAIVGDDAVVQVIDGVSIRLPNNVALLGLKDVSGTIQMLKVTSGDLLQLGEGSVPIYLNSSTLIGANESMIQYDPTTPKNALTWSVSGSLIQLGNSAEDLDIFGNSIDIGQGSITVRVVGATFGMGMSSKVLIEQNNVPLVGVYSSTEYDIAKIDSTGNEVFGSSAREMLLTANNFVTFNFSGDVACQFLGWLSGSASIATTTELPNDHDYCIWENTTGSIVSWCFNDGGTIRQVL